MIKILIITSIFLIVLWILSELFKKKQGNDNFKKNNKKSFSYFILFIIFILIVFILLPKIGGTSLGFLNKFLMPIFSIIKNIIPL